jgi:glycosyltransferase involved in cell wall biosynthesis
VSTANADGDDVVIDDDGSPDESAAEVARRRAEDALVVEAMRGIQFDVEHPMGQALVKQLRETGAGTLIVLNRDQELFPRARRLRVGLPTPPPHNWPSEARSLLNAAATEAAPRFTRTTLARWSPEGGASILTYFVNNTIMNEFKTMYCAYYRGEKARCDHEVAYDDEIDRGRCLLAGPDELDKTLDRQLIKEARRLMDSRQERIFDGIEEGLQLTDIARALDVHPRTIKREIQRYQHELRERHRWTSEDGAR